MPGKSRRNGRAGTNFAPIPLQDTKVQRKCQKRKQNSENFSEKLRSAFYCEITIFCAVTCAHYAGRTTRGELERKKMREKYSSEDTRKKPAQWMHGCYFEPIPLQDTKVQRKYQKRKQNSGNFYRKITLRLLLRNHNILRLHVRPLRRAHKARRVGIKMLLIYAFIIRIYSQLQHQLHKQLDVTRHKSTFRIYVTTNHKASV